MRVKVIFFLKKKQAENYSKKTVRKMKVKKITQKKSEICKTKLVTKT